MIRRDEVRDYCQGRQQNYAAARVLLPQALLSLKKERDQAKVYIDDILSTLAPYLPEKYSYDVVLVDDCNVADTLNVDDGSQLICINRHFLQFLRNLIELIARGICLGEDGQGIVNLNMDDNDTRLFGLGIGEYLNFGTPISFPPTQSGDLGPKIYIAAIEFIIAHEIVHGIEGDSEDSDFELDGFQDFCRLRGREYRCDRMALALTLKRRKHLDLPETALLGAVCALTAISWIEQFTPGHVPESWHHPGSDSRVLRLYLEEQLYWRNAGLDGQPNGLTGAALRRAFRFLRALEADPKAIASPLNRLIQRCISSGTPDHNLFETRIGLVFTRGRVIHVARSVGAMWGSSELFGEEERLGKFEAPQGQLACALFRRLHEKLLNATAAAREIADKMAQAKEHRLNSPLS